MGRREARFPSLEGRESRVGNPGATLRGSELPKHTMEGLTQESATWDCWSWAENAGSSVQDGAEHGTASGASRQRSKVLGTSLLIW